MGSKGVARRGLIAFLLCAAVACGCHRVAQDLRVALSLDPVAPTAGSVAAVRVTLRDGQARPLRGARLQVEAHMSHPGMAPLVAGVFETGAGTYTTHIPFSMAGEWTLVVTGVLADGRRVAAHVERTDVRPAPRPIAMDLLRQPVIASVLASRRARRCLQLTVLGLAAATVLHGLFGPQVGPRNLATVLTSIHWRGLLIVGLVLAGNLFCFGCPIVLSRDAARRFVTPRLRWPRRLRGRWIALGLLAFAFFAYELWDLWDQPRTTAWLILGYFGLALVVDLTFKGASFCKYVCPIGQFDFAASTISPTEVQVRDPDVCGTCRTFDCIRGRQSDEPPRHTLARGCELGLFLPAKVGNLNCTMCFDCVRACPHDNIGLMTRAPGSEWLLTGRRSGIGRVNERVDLAAVSLVFTSAALFNALAMTAPGTAAERWLGAVTGVTSEIAMFSLLFVAAVVLIPTAIVALAAVVTQGLTKTAHGVLGTAVPYVHALLPLGVGVWLAHYGFHLLTGVLTIVPVTQSAVIDATGIAALGDPMWRWPGMRPGAVFPLQVGVVLLATAGTMGLIGAVSWREHPQRAGRAAAPWIAVAAAACVIALWISMQPMDMRGVGPG